MTKLKKANLLYVLNPANCIRLAMALKRVEKDSYLRAYLYDGGVISRKEFVRLSKEV